MSKNSEPAAPVNVQINDVKSPQQPPKSAHSGTNSLRTSSEYPDEVKTTSSLEILERIHKETILNLFASWTFADVVSLIRHTMANIAGAKGEQGEFMSSEEVLKQWTDFMSHYSAFYFTNENLWSLKVDFERSQQPLPSE